MEKVTEKQYGEAVATLLKLAFAGGGSSTSAAAQLLLSAFNGNEWHVDITTLCSFDQEHYQAALTVIRGRSELYIEPHNVVEDGQRKFTKLWDKYYLLHVGNRNLSVCGRCDGDGKEWDEETVIGPCRQCGGAGRVDEPRWSHERNLHNRFKSAK